MLFKSPTGQPIQVAILTGCCAVVGDEWRELPVDLHRKAIEEGCITSDMDLATINAGQPQPSADKSNEQILIEVIKAMMENPEASDFRSDGMPNIKSVIRNCGWTASREEVAQAVQAIADEAQAIADAAEAAGGGGIGG